VALGDFAGIGAGLLLAMAAGYAGYAAGGWITEPLGRMESFLAGLKSAPSGTLPTIPADLLPVSPAAGDEIVRLARRLSDARDAWARQLDDWSRTRQGREQTEDDLRGAGDVQQNLLTRAPLLTGQFAILGVMEPARAAGGDFYEYAMLDEHRLVFIIGDVAGKGMSAAMFMSATLALFRVFAGRPPAAAADKDFILDVMGQVDAELSAHNEMMTFVTTLMGVMDTRTGEVVMANGGHCAPVFLRANGHCALAPLRPGLVLGVGFGGFQATRLSLGPGEGLLFYTDGVVEALSPADEFYGEERMLASLTLPTGHKRRPEETLGRLFASVGEFAAGREQADDIAAVCLMRR